MKVPLLDSLPLKKRRLVIRVVGLFLFYTVFGFLILPVIVRMVATKQLAKQLDREVSIAKVKINPYVLSATVRGLLIKDKDGQPFLSWDEVYVNVQLSSFLGHPWVLKEITTTRPFFRAQVNKDRSLNFTDLIEKFSRVDTNTPPPKPAKPLALRIGQFRIAGASASITDLTPRTPFTRTIGPLEITLNNFRTDPSSKNPYSFTGTTDAGERFSWSGHFFLDPIRSHGEFSLENLALSKYAPLYQDFVRFDIRGGLIDLRAAYEVVWGQTNHVAIVTNFAFNLRSLKIAEAGATNTFAELDRLSVSELSVDAIAHRAEIGSVTAVGGHFTLRRNADASINLLEAAKPRADAPQAPGSVEFILRSVTNAVAMILSTTNDWQGTLHALNADDHTLRLEDLANSRPVQLTLDAITLHATNLSNLPGQILTARSSVRWNTNGTIATAVEAALVPLRAHVALYLDHLDLAPVDPYGERFASALIQSGALSVHGAIEVTRGKDALPDARFHGDLTIDDLGVLDREFGEELLSWKSLRVTGLDATLDPLGAKVAEVALLDPRANIIINTNRHINLLTAARMEELNPLLGDTNAPAAGKKPDKKPAASQLALLASRVAPTNSAPSSVLPKVSIGTIAITNADFRFADRSLTPFVKLAFSKLTGTIAGLSTEELQRADVHLMGLVDGTAPAEITGHLNPLNQKEATDFTVTFKDIDLHPTSPYAGKFLGYRLNKGKLSLAVKYEVSERKLKASNLITIDQLTLGEKVDSPDATKLPVRLAIAVLKDRNGRIELDVPIAGTLDDPEFKLGRVITHTLVNIITKIVTSPFAALGAIFGGKGEEISFQDFAPGSSELQPSSIEKLDTLVKGLYERPGLELEIEGSIDPAADRAALAKQKIETELRDARWKSLGKSAQAKTTPAQIVLTPEDYQDRVKELHAAAFTPEALIARGAKNPPASTNAIASTNLAMAVATNAPAGIPRVAAVPSRSGDKGASALLTTTARAKVAPQDMESQLLATIEVTDSERAALAVARAQRVKDYLLQTGKVETNRLFFTETAGQPGATNGSRVYLHLR